MRRFAFLIATVAAQLFTQTAFAQRIEQSQGEHVVLLGSGMASRMTKFGHFETELYLSFPDKDLVVRNMADEGNTPGFRPHPGRNYEFHFAFPGAKVLIKNRK